MKEKWNPVVDVKQVSSTSGSNNIFQKKTTRLFKIAEKPHFRGYLVVILGPPCSFLVVNKE